MVFVLKLGKNFLC